MFTFAQMYTTDQQLAQPRDEVVTRYALTEATRLAMLGMGDECNAICKALADHGQFDPGKAGLKFQCIWVYSGIQPPDIKDASGSAVWVPSERDIAQKELESRRQMHHLPKWFDWDNINMDTLEKMRETADASQKGEYACATTGYDAMRASAEYAAVLSMASTLNHPDVVANLMPLMTSRIRANQQAHYLSLIPALWRDYFLTGWLREQLSIDKAALQERASRLLDAITTRFEKGPRGPEEIYCDFTVEQLLDVINQNTVSSSGYAEWLRDSTGAGSDGDDTTRHRHSILNPGVTSKQLEATEKRIGHKLPDDLKDFFRQSNGCGPVRLDDDFFMVRLPSLDQLDFEDEEYMANYAFEVVPGLPFQMGIDWPGIVGGGIAMYEHEGQTTQYVWVVGAELIRRGKESLQAAYDEATVDDKAKIDRLIRFWYGDRETYDAMTDYCYFEVAWGERATAIHPNFKSYLARVACESQHPTEENVFEER